MSIHTSLGSVTVDLSKWTALKRSNFQGNPYSAGHHGTYTFAVAQPDGGALRGRLEYDGHKGLRLFFNDALVLESHLAGGDFGILQDLKTAWQLGQAGGGGAQRCRGASRRARLSGGGGTRSRRRH